MLSFLALLPRSLTTFLYAVAALLRFYGNTTTIPFQFIRLTLLDYSFWAFILGSAALVVNLGLVEQSSCEAWHSGNRNRNCAAEERARADQERNRAAEERERAAGRARIQNQFIILQIRYQLTPGPETGAPLRDFLAFLEEYGE